MCLMDTTDGLFMNVAYGWAFFNPVRKVFYNLAITGLSVAICFLIGGIETLSLIPRDWPGTFSQTSGFWGWRSTSTSTPRASSSWARSSSPARARS
jgi:nickel/cobalt transporter (NiCoT) family protein